MGLIRTCAVFGALMGIVCNVAYPAGSLSNRRAPGFSLPDQTMKQYDPQDFRGKIVIIDFMQTKCPTCKVISGLLEQVKSKFGDKIQLMSVVILPDSIDNVRAYIKENNTTAPILFDSGQMTASFMKITPQNPTIKFPHLFLLDKEGWIRNDFDHDDANNGTITVKLLTAEIEKLLQGAGDKKR